MELRLTPVREILARCSRGIGASQHILVQFREPIGPCFHTPAAHVKALQNRVDFGNFRDSSRSALCFSARLLRDPSQGPQEV
jgi:hypothetical protein